MILHIKVSCLHISDQKHEQFDLIQIINFLFKKLNLLISDLYHLLDQVKLQVVKRWQL